MLIIVDYRSGASNRFAFVINATKDQAKGLKGDRIHLVMQISVVIFSAGKWKDIRFLGKEMKIGNL